MRTITENRELIQAEGGDANLRYSHIASAGQEYFEGTALTSDKPWSREDVLRTRQFLEASAPFAHPKLLPSYWEHLVIASLYSRILAEKVPCDDLNPNEAESLLLLHDVGRLVAPHRYLRNDYIANIIYRKIGIRSAFLKKMPSMNDILGLSPQAFRVLEDVQEVQRITTISDNIGKKSFDGMLFDVNSMVNYDLSHQARYPEGVWPSEKRGLNAMTEEGKQRFALELLLEEIEWLKRKYGIDFDFLRFEAAQEFEKPDNQNYLSGLKT